jgi:DNA-binding NarL/FixJ family response regulator
VTWPPRDRSQLRVAVADDQQLVRFGFATILDAQDDMDVVGEAEDGSSAVELCRSARPDVILMDIRMPGMDGIEATRVLTGDPSVNTRVIVLTTFDLDEYVYAALQAGASGFLLKDTSPEMLTHALRTVMAGEACVAGSVMTRLIASYVRRPLPTAVRALRELTAREQEVLRLVGRGRNNDEIARELFISQTTVKTHLARLFQKTGTRDRAQAVILAYEAGLVTPGEPPSDNS